MKDLTGSVPITVSIALSRVWSKDAKAVYDSEGCMMLWEPPKEDESNSE